MRKWIGYLLFFFGFAMFLYPAASTMYQRYQNNQIIRDFDLKKHAEEKRNQEALESIKTMNDSEEECFNKESDSLYLRMKDYNHKISEDGQKEFCDAWSYTQPPVSLEGLENDCFGYIEIDAMDVKLPLYVGATMDNLRKGAAILGQTSFPIGEENTNSVIAGHRGYQGMPYFREIERLKTGDIVRITNPWETLLYAVEEIRIIKPNDTDAVKIRQGEEMITLITCHPYRSHGKMRYCVYCRRINDLEEVVQTDKESEISLQEDSSGQFESSQEDILMEKLIYQSGFIVLLIILLKKIFNSIKRKRRNA